LSVQSPSIRHAVLPDNQLQVSIYLADIIGLMKYASKLSQAKISFCRI
jgi:hypothetical protein